MIIRSRAPLRISFAGGGTDVLPFAAEQGGIVLNATENVLNDSWCFGLSQDIPWTMVDKSAINRWFRHVDDLKSICGDKVDPLYWESVARLSSDISVPSRG